MNYISIREDVFRDSPRMALHVAADQEVNQVIYTTDVPSGRAHHARAVLLSASEFVRLAVAAAKGGVVLPECRALNWFVDWADQENPKRIF